ncbi:MAG: hypothetical protein IT429_11920 [Gemmataceae bacterium]|nr:hypothetical protein [Gemmataceae bacterium]
MTRIEAASSSAAAGALEGAVVGAIAGGLLGLLIWIVFPYKGRNPHAVQPESTKPGEQGHKNASA